MPRTLEHRSCFDFTRDPGYFGQVSLTMVKSVTVI
jgi:hypothetical protein